MTNQYPPLSPFRLSAEKFTRELLLETVGACAIGFVNRNIGQCLPNFCPFQQSQRIKMAGINRKHVKSFFRVLNLFYIVLVTQRCRYFVKSNRRGIEPKPFGTAEMRQERGGRGSHQAHDRHADYVKSGQYGHAHVSTFRDDEEGGGGGGGESFRDSIKF